VSNKLLNKAWDVQGLTPAGKLVLLAMSDVARDESDNRCFATQETLIEMTGISKKHLGTTIKELVRLKHITPEQLKGRTVKGGIRFRYHVHPLTGEASSPVTGELRSSDRCNPQSRQVNSVPPTGELASLPNNVPLFTTISPKGIHAPLPFPKDLPGLIRGQIKRIRNCSPGDTILPALIEKLAEYETQLYGAPTTKNCEPRDASEIKRLCDEARAAIDEHTRAAADHGMERKGIRENIEVQSFE